MYSLQPFNARKYSGRLPLVPKVVRFFTYKRETFSCREPVLLLPFQLAIVSYLSKFRPDFKRTATIFEEHQLETPMFTSHGSRCICILISESNQSNHVIKHSRG